MRNFIRVAAVAVTVLPCVAVAAPRPVADSAARAARMCDGGSREVIALPLDRYQHTLTMDDAQHGAFGEVSAAVMMAEQDIKAACPRDTVPSAPERIAAMQKRIEAMVGAVAAVRLPLEKFYGLLNDEQKEQVIAIDQRQGQRGILLGQDCGAAQASVAEWPTAGVERAVRPNDAQGASLVVLQAAIVKAGDTAKSACPTETLLTPTARLAAVGQQLDAQLVSVKAVRGPLEDFYGTLDENQKARFDAISLSQTSQADLPSKAKPTATGHRRHFVSIGYLIHRILRPF